MRESELRFGLKVRTLREFSGVPVGTIGVVEEAKNSWPIGTSVCIHWARMEGDPLRDWFGTDELSFLEVVR
jgi:hypothetical protein